MTKTTDPNKEAQQAFIDDLRQLEAKHGYEVVAILNVTQAGIVPTLGLNKKQTEETVA